MTRRKGNFAYNYPRVIKYLKDNDIQYESFADGQHLKIWGDTQYIELWPSRMTWHIIESENLITSQQKGYNRLSFYFNKQEFANLISGELHAPLKTR